MATYQQDVSATLIQLADTLVSDFELLGYLDVLLQRSTAVLEADAGGVMLADADDTLQLLAATDERVRLMELFELQRREGPCVEAHRDGRTVVAEDLLATDRWPRFAPAAVETGYRAAFAFPMRLRHQQIGALNLFRTRPGSVDPALLASTRAFADMATIGILQERAVRQGRELANQLQGALNSRIVLEQAKGMVAQTLDCDMGEAYQLLRWHARRNNLALRSVAAAVLARDLSPADLRLREVAEESR